MHTYSGIYGIVERESMLKQGKAIAGSIDAATYVDMSGCPKSQRYLFIPVSVFRDQPIIELKRGKPSPLRKGHAVTIIVDLVDGTYDVFDPNGRQYTDGLELLFFRDKINNEAHLILPDHAANRPYKFARNSDICPLRGPQSLIQSSWGSPLGICGLWAPFVIYWHLRNPNLSMPEFPSRRDYNSNLGKYSKVTALLKDAHVYHDAVIDIYNSMNELALVARYNALVESQFVQASPPILPTRKSKRRSSRRKVSYVPDVKKRRSKTSRRHQEQRLSLRSYEKPPMRRHRRSRSRG